MRALLVVMLVALAGCYSALEAENNPADPGCTNPDGTSCHVCANATFAGLTCDQCADPSLESCADACVDEQTDPNNCNGCGHACESPTSACVAAACVCPTGGSLCSGACVDEQTDPNNCGGCGHACESPTSQCSAASCVARPAVCGPLANPSSVPTCPAGQICNLTGQCGAPQYTDNGDGTVTDNLTGLVWQMAATSNTYSQPNAETYCSGNTPGLPGTGWTLPSLAQLFSLLELGGTSPYIDQTAFPATPDNYYWTSTLYSGNNGLAWGVAFNYGYAGNYFAVTGDSYVRCVR